MKNRVYGSYMEGVRGILKMNKKERLRFIDKIIRIQSYNLQGKNIKHEIENLRIDLEES